MGVREILSWIIIGVLGVLLILSLADSGEPSIEVVKGHTDTLVITKIDSVFIEKPIIKEEKVVEEKIIYVHDTIKVPIPISEYRFKEEGLFDFRVKGFDVSFISAEVYPKTVTQVIETATNTTVKENKSTLFIFGGFSAISDTFYPKGGIALSLKNKWLISADIGYFQKQPIWGCTIGYNMLNK